MMKIRSTVIAHTHTQWALLYILQTWPGLGTGTSDHKSPRHFYTLQSNCWQQLTIRSKIILWLIRFRTQCHTITLWCTACITPAS